MALSASKVKPSFRTDIGLFLTIFEFNVVCFQEKALFCYEKMEIDMSYEKMIFLQLNSSPDGKTLKCCLSLLQEASNTRRKKYKQKITPKLLYNIFLLLFKEKMDSLFLNSTSLEQIQNGKFPASFPQDEQFSIEIYFVAQALMKNSIPKEECLEVINEIVKTPSPQITPSILDSSELSSKRAPSIFHNFQKHIITLFRKYCLFGPPNFPQNQYGKAACSLWQAFLKMKTCSKKIFNIIFGFSASLHTEGNINLLAGQFKEFRTIKDKYGVDTIIKAQELIRSMVCEQLTNVPREVLALTCRVDNFNVFYFYLIWFLKMLKKGQVNKRITKQQVLMLVNANFSLEMIV